MLILLQNESASICRQWKGSVDVAQIVAQIIGFVYSLSSEGSSSICSTLTRQVDMLFTPFIFRVRRTGGEEIEKEACFVLGLLAIKAEHQHAIADKGALTGLVGLLKQHVPSRCS